MPAAREPVLDQHAQHPATSSPRRIWIPLVLLTLAGAWLRLGHLGEKSLWLDEGATVALARASWQHFTWVWWRGEANLQTIYFLLMRGWIYFGMTEALLRLPSAIFGIASIPMMYAVARRFMTVGPAMAAAALLTFNPTHVYYSQEARSYTLAILLVLWSTLCFVRAVESRRPRDWALWTVSGILAFYTHDFAALVLVAQACSMYFREKPRPWRPLLIGGAVIFLAALPGLTYVFRASPENLNFIWMGRPSPRGVMHLAMFFSGAGVKACIALVLWIAGVLAIRRTRRNAADEWWRGMLLLLWMLLPPLFLALVSLWHPLFTPRYMIFSLAAALLLAAIGAGALRRWRTGFVLVVLLCGISVPTIVDAYGKPREDWRAASDAILSVATPGDAVVFFPFYTQVMLDYYRDRYPVPPPAIHVFAPPYYDAGKDVHTLLAALDANPHQFPHVWVVVYRADGQLGNFDSGAAAEQKLRAIFGAPQVRTFTDVEVLEFGR